MIALGIDPGARWTAFALIDTTDTTRRPELIDALTIDRRDESLYAGRRGGIPEGASQLADPLDLPDEYLEAVAQTATILGNHDSAPPNVIGVEWIRRPSWRVAGREKPLDPGAILATAIVAGVILGELRRNPTHLERVRPMGNGRLLPLTAYPDPISTTGAGHDKHRHERSAYDVAMLAAQQYRTQRGRRP